MSLAFMLIVLALAIAVCSVALWFVVTEGRDTAPRTDPLAGLSPDARRVLGVRGGRGYR